MIVAYSQALACAITRPRLRSHAGQPSGIRHGVHEVVQHPDLSSTSLPLCDSGSPALQDLRLQPLMARRMWMCNLVLIGALAIPNTNGETWLC